MERWSVTFALWVNTVRAAFARSEAGIELAVLVACLVVAGLVTRAFKQSSVSLPRAPGLAGGSVRRLTYPVTGILLLLVARGVFHAIGYTTAFFGVVIFLLMALAGIRMAVFALRHAFAPSSWLASFERGISITVWSLLVLHVTGLLPDLIGWMDSIELPVGKQHLSLWTLLHGSLWVLATLLFALWIAGLVESRVLRAEGLDNNLRIVLARVIKALLSLLAIMIVLPMVGIDLTALSVFGGALGVGLGFGMQKIMANYVSGFILLLDRSIHIGNVITVGSARGQVTQITTRYTVLRGNTGVEVIVPNETLVGSVVESETLSDPKVRIALPVQVSYGSDVERAMALLVGAAVTQSRVLADPPPTAYLVRFADSGIDLELGFWIADPQEGTLSVRSAINLQVWRAFKAEGIEIPFPQREVRLLGDALLPVAHPPPPASGPGSAQVSGT